MISAYVSGVHYSQEYAYEDGAENAEDEADEEGEDEYDDGEEDEEEEGDAGNGDVHSQEGLEGSHSVSRGLVGDRLLLPDAGIVCL